MSRTLSRGRPVTLARAVGLRFAGLAHANLRAACEAARVPLVDVDGWPVPDAEVVEAVVTARLYPSLERAALVLVSESRCGALQLGSRVFAGPISMPEALVLASVLRSSVGDGAVSA